MKEIFIICGPTASGKTSLAISLAQKLNAEIISADSRQVYKELNIGVAKPSNEDLKLVKHHFIGSVSISENFTAGMYAQLAREVISKYFETNNSIVICGGTGLYIKALFEGLNRPPVSEEIRERVNHLMETHELSHASDLLIQKDPQLASEINLDNPRRVQRALEWVLAGKPQSEVEPIPTDWKISSFGIGISREELYRNINFRVDQMLKEGLWEEVESLVPYQNLNALQTVGYKEIFDCKKGLLTQNEAIEKIKQHTRNYAKRQITWFNNEHKTHWLTQKSQEEMVEEILLSQGS
jgi:tRNA dimethylallyltransferase